VRARERERQSRGGGWGMRERERELCVLVYALSPTRWGVMRDNRERERECGCIVCALPLCARATLGSDRRERGTERRGDTATEKEGGRPPIYRYIHT